MINMIIRFDKNFFISFIVINVVFLFLLFSFSKEIIGLYIINVLTTMYLMTLLNCYLFFLKKITLEHSNGDILIYKNNILYAKYKYEDILTDDRETAYIFDSKFILFGGICFFVLRDSDLDNLKVLSKNFRIVHDNIMFKSIIKNTYFMSGLIAFLLLILNFIFTTLLM